MENTLVGEKTIAFSIAQEILTTSVKIPNIPENGAKILSIARLPKDKIDIPSFVKLVESDPGLFTKILELANSPFYREVEKILSLRSAITRVGLIEVVDSVCLYFFQKMLPRFPDIHGFSFHDFWLHSWACAMANRRLGHPNLEMDVLPGELYMAGLLHGIGKLLLAIHFPDDFSKCIQKAVDLKCPLETMERDIFGTTDALVASKVLGFWNLPANVCEAVAFQQMPESAPPEHIIHAGLTQYARSIAELSGVGNSGDGVKMEVSDTYFGKLPSLRISKPEIREKLIKEILASLKGRADSVIQKSKTGKTQKKNIRNSGSAGKAGAPKKGMFGWVKSFLSK